MWILGIKGFKQPFMALLSPSWTAESYPHFCKDLGVEKKWIQSVHFLKCFLVFFPLHYFVITSCQVQIQFRSYSCYDCMKTNISRKMQICSKENLKYLYSCIL